MRTIDSQKINIALAGNPNSGKSTLFNHLTGARQKTGNFPGVTVDRKVGKANWKNTNINIIDLPGTYSIYPRALDEKVVFDFFFNKKDPNYPDLLLFVADATNLERNLLLFSQIRDLGIPMVLLLNRTDLLEKEGKKVNKEVLEEALGVPVLFISARSGEGITELKTFLSAGHFPTAPEQPLLDITKFTKDIVEDVQQHFNTSNAYQAYQLLQQTDHSNALSDEEKKWLTDTKGKYGFNADELQAQETTFRYQKIKALTKRAIQQESIIGHTVSDKIDRIITHRVYGFIVFLGILFLMFQAIFAWAEYPMEWLEDAFAWASANVSEVLPSGPLSNLIAEGVIPGLAGVLVFIPQIAILFGFIALLEESGYMSRAVFLMDRIMRKFGLNGKSVVPLISGAACAIPAVMAARSIGNWKERLITILVVPFMSCAARLPVYIIIIKIVIPEKDIWGIFHSHGLVLMAMYLLGLFAAIFSAVILHLFIRSQQSSYFIMELPTYQWPTARTVALTALDKSKTFAWEAGRIIFAISIILWVAASYGPEGYIDEGKINTAQANSEDPVSPETYRLEHSFAGIAGHAMEPVLKPLGYDWKIGIAIVTSFAAREIFVGSLATLYQMDEDDEGRLTEVLKKQKKDSGEKLFNLATGLSLLVFYAFALQCMSTVAIVKRETGGWKWPIWQFVAMTAIAYVSAYIIYQITV